MYYSPVPNYQIPQCVKQRFMPIPMRILPQPIQNFKLKVINLKVFYWMMILMVTFINCADFSFFIYPLSPPRSNIVSQTPGLLGRFPDEYHIFTFKTYMKD